MNIPGMPAGMMKPQRVCQGDDPSRAATQDPSKKDCKVTDSKKTATGTTVTLSCPDGSTMTIDQQYNAARTEFKSTMTSKGGKAGRHDREHDRPQGRHLRRGGGEQGARREDRRR